MDVGSDHGHLLFSLLKSGRIRHGIAIENKSQPWANSHATLADVKAEVRLGDGLEPLEPGESDSLSICGMGGQSIVRILTRYPERVPHRLVLQPNQDAGMVRRWAFENGYRLIDEVWVGPRGFDVLVIVRSSDTGKKTPDPVYEGLELGAAFLLGPRHLRRRDSAFIDRIRIEREYYSRLAGKTDQVRHRLDCLDYVLGIENRVEDKPKPCRDETSRTKN